MVTQVHEPNKLVLAVNHNHMGYKLDAWAHSAIKLHIYGKIHCLGRKIGKCSIKCQNITISNLANYIYIYITRQVS
jgi:phosphoribosylaminoimidazole carboxylase (NCAIR synthetase)